jgi:hypothetical protein
VFVDRWDAGGAGVEVAAALPIAALRRAIGELNFAAVADGPVAAAGTAACFEDRTCEAGFAELMRRDKASDSPAQDKDFLSFAEAGGKLRQRRETGSFDQSEGLHRGKRSGVSADKRHALDKRASSQAHSRVLHAVTVCVSWTFP